MSTSNLVDISGQSFQIILEHGRLIINGVETLAKIDIPGREIIISDLTPYGEIPQVIARAVSAAWRELLAPRLAPFVAQFA